MAVVANGVKLAAMLVSAAENLQREEMNRQLKEVGLSAVHDIHRLIKVRDIPVLGSSKTHYTGLRQLLAG